MVEQLTRNEQVAGSTPIFGSRAKSPDLAFLFFFGICHKPKISYIIGRGIGRHENGLLWRGMGKPVN